MVTSLELSSPLKRLQCFNEVDIQQVERCPCPFQDGMVFKFHEHLCCVGELGHLVADAHLSLPPQMINLENHVTTAVGFRAIRIILHTILPKWVSVGAERYPRILGHV